MATYVIGYDISEVKRLQRAYRAMLRYAAPVEYSIFLLHGTERDMEICIRDLRGIIDEKSDDIRCYRLPLRGLQQRLGKACFPSGIVWTGMPSVLG